MIGQTKLQQQFNNYTVTTLPRAILLIGETGCGKHLLVRELSLRFSLPIIPIEQNVSRETLVEYSNCPVPKIYLIDLSFFIDKQQNQFLKFIEDSSPNTTIMLIATPSTSILTTIYNRCQVFQFEPYTTEELREIVALPNDLAYQICHTPGQLKVLDYAKLSDLKTLCEKIIYNLKIVSYSNFMTILTKINYKDEYSKYDFNLFFNMLIYVAQQEIISKSSVANIAELVYQRCIETLSKLIVKTISLETVMTRFLSALWTETH